MCETVLARPVRGRLDGKEEPMLHSFVVTPVSPMLTSAGIGDLLGIPRVR